MKRKPLPMAAALDAHSASLSVCRRCSGRGEGVRPIVSEARAPKAMLVGQAPGKMEVYDQRAFAGRAGKTLFRWLAAAGVDEATFRANVYIAAITRCYPGPASSGRGDRVPSPAEKHECGVWLDHELRIIRPALVVPVGRLAVDRFLGPVPLEDVIGQVHTVEHAGGTSTCIPLPHPSGASSWIHAPGHRDLLDAALRLLRAAFAAAEIFHDHRPSRRSA